MQRSTPGEVRCATRLTARVWFQDAGTCLTVLRLDVASGKIEASSRKIPRPSVYDVIPDKQNNGYFLPLGSEEIGRIDAKPVLSRCSKTPTPGSGPRRGMMDQQERLWFGENRADRIGMFDTKTQKFQEWPAPTPGRLALRRDRRQERRGVGRRRIQRPHHPSRSPNQSADG